MATSRPSAIKKAQNAELNRAKKKGVDTERLNLILDFNAENVQLPFAVASLFPLKVRDKCNKLLSTTESIMSRYKGTSYNNIAYGSTVTRDEAELRSEINSLCSEVVEFVLYKLRHQYRSNVNNAAVKAWQKYIAPFIQATTHHKSNTFMYFWSETVVQLIARLIVEPCTNAGHIRCAWEGYMLTEYVQLPYLDALDEFIPDSPYFHYLSNLRFEKELMESNGTTYPPNDLSDMFSDIFEMYPVLMKGFNPHKNIIRLPDSLGYMMIAFCPDTVLLEIKIAPSENEVIHCRNSGKLPVTFSFKWDGTIIHGLSNWMAVGRSTPLYSFLVYHVHKVLVPMYVLALEGIDKTREENQNDDDIDKLYSVWTEQIHSEHKQKKDKKECAEPPISNTQIPKMRRNRFFRVCKELGLKVEPGKGSELKIYRPGSRIFVLGTHGVKNDVIPSWLATKILARAEVTPSDFKRALNG